MLRGIRVSANDIALVATIVPGVRPSNFKVSVDINKFYFSFGQVHDGPLREMAEQRNVYPTGVLRECQ